MNDYPLQFLKSGIAVIPIENRGKRPYSVLLPRNDDNNHSWEIYKSQLPTEYMVANWLNATTNYGVVTGWNGLIVLDFDSVSDYSKWRLWACKRGGFTQYIAEHAFQVQTSRGVHVYLRSAVPGTNRKLGNIDIKYRGYVVGPGSIHPSGAVYKPLRKSFVFPIITSLSDALPAQLLVTPDILSGKGVVAKAIASDPWETASNIGNIEPGQDLISAIRQRFKIDHFLKIQRRFGKWGVAQCPFHDDNHPSFWIDTEREIGNCFACNFPKPLDVVNLFAIMHGISNLEAIWAMSKML